MNTRFHTGWSTDADASGQALIELERNYGARNYDSLPVVLAHGDGAWLWDEHGRRYPAFFRINFSRCIFCGYCEDACPTYAIQLTPDFEMGEYKRQNLVYEKEHLLIDGVGKYPGYNFWRVAGVQIGGKDKGESERENPPTDVHRLLP